MNTDTPMVLLSSRLQDLEPSWHSQPHTIADNVAKHLANIKATRDALDAEEIRCKWLWNSALAVTRLPNEIMVAIFRWYHIIDSPEDVYVHNEARPEWMLLMGVCQYWRNVAISTPSLWTNINIDGRCKTDHALLTLFLTRSSRAPLCVSIQRHSKAHFALLRPHFHRVRQLIVARIASKDMSVYRSLLSQHSMPLLTDLTLECPVRTALESNPSVRQPVLWSHDRCPLLSHLSLGLFPNLRDPHIYANLRSLVLRSDRNLFGDDIDFNQSHFDQFLDLLSLCSRIESLVLHAFLCQFGLPKHGSPAPWRPSIKLPSLTSVGIESDYPEEINPFLSHLVLPPTASLRINANLGYLDIATNDRFSDLLPINRSETLPTLASLVHASLTVDDGDCCVYCRTAATDGSKSRSVSLSLYSLTRTYPVSNLAPRLSMGLSDLVHILTDSGATRGLTTLSITASLDVVGALQVSEPAGSYASWTTLFAAFSNLEVLRVYAGASRILPFFDMLRVLSTVSSAGEDQGPASASASLASETIATLPHLRELEAVGSDAPLNAGAAGLERVVRCLEYRAARGARLERLRLGIAYVDDPSGVRSYGAWKALPGYLPQLEALVDTVEYLDNSEAIFRDTATPSAT